MTTNASTTVYSIGTDGKASYDELDLDTRYELGLSTQESSEGYMFYDESDYYDEWCFVCSRPTDHRGEHDDLVISGRASYDPLLGMVYRTR